MTAPTPPLRTQQREALDTLATAWQEGRRRAWVSLPPGAGKTRVGLETALDRLSAGGVERVVERVVVLAPNTAIQGQWARAATEIGLDAGTDRDLAQRLTALTYQAVAVFDDDADEQSGSRHGVGAPPGTGLLDRLHDNGRELVDRIRSGGPVLLVLDECHHLLEVWGRLLAELLEEIPDAWVLGLTATPPESLTTDQAALVDELFGPPLFHASIPAVVREGDLAPFCELAFVTTPTPTEQDWLTQEATRFHELVTQLTDPGFGSVPFLSWLDARFTASATPWPTLVRERPDLAMAALRVHHVGLVGLPPGARVTEAARQEPTADDWVLLIDDWLSGSVARSDLPGDHDVLDAVRAALPSVGYRWTRSGVRRGRSAVDRVLARSEAKAGAVAQIVAAEHLNLGERLRLLVLTDHERAGATLPVDLTGVLRQQSGSAHALLETLADQPEAAQLRPLLVTGATVAGTPDTLTAFRDALPDQSLAARLTVAPLDPDRPDGPLARLDGPWSSRVWVPAVTAWFEGGGSRVLVGTRALLGEGWDARRVTGVADVTTATTSTAVVQTRGRALRTDPDWPDKVAVNWSLVCVTDRHPRGNNDWDRLVRKHSGYFGPDADGQVVDGVAHLDAAFSAFGPPATADLDAANARALLRGEHRDDIRMAWRVGEPYHDTALPTVRIRTSNPTHRVTLGDGAEPAGVVLRPDALEVRAAPAPRRRADMAVVAAVVTTVAVGLLAGLAMIWVLLLVALVGGAVGVGVGHELRLRYGAALLAAATQPPSVLQVASAVADGLHASGLVSRGAAAVEVTIDSDGEYRCVLGGVTPEQAGVFATALEEAVAPIALPRYLVCRYQRIDRPTSWWQHRRDCALAASGRLRPDGEVWHAVPTVLGARAASARTYATAWDHWIGGGAAVRTGSAEGQGVLAAQQGADPFDVTTVIRRSWS